MMTKSAGRHQCEHVHTYIYIHTCIHTCVCIHMYVYTYMHSYVHIRIQINGESVKLERKLAANRECKHAYAKSIAYHSRGMPHIHTIPFTRPFALSIWGMPHMDSCLSCRISTGYALSLSCISTAYHTRTRPFL